MRFPHSLPTCALLLQIAVLLIFNSVIFDTQAAAIDKIFPSDAVVDVTKPPYNVRPDDNVDDTAALQQAITENIGTGKSLYFPAGTYHISKPLVCKNPEGIWRAQITIQGQNRESTILKLSDAAPGYSDPEKPQAIFVTGSHEEPGDAADGGGNKAFRNNIFDLTFDIGSKNPGAVAIDYAVSNQGAIKNVTIRSADGSGKAGISLLRRIPGPGLIKDVAIEGFDTGIDIDDIEYGFTVEKVSLKNQKVAGIRNGRNLLHIHGLKSGNTVPALSSTGPAGVVTLVDADLYGSYPEQMPVASGGNIFARDIRMLKENSPELELVNPPPLGTETTAAILPVEDTPEFWNADAGDWAAIGPRAEGEADDTAAIQRALDSGKGTIYFPINRTYFLSDTVVVRGAVKQVLGMGAEISLGAAEKPFRDPANPRPLFRIDPTTAPTVFFENMFFNAQYPGEVLFENNSPANVVIKHSMGWVGGKGQRRTYRNTDKATGKLFVEDVFLPGWEFTNQKVWARQFNPENHDGDGSYPQVTNTGGKLWILGFKTEGPAPFIKTAAGGITELLGAYNYISATALPEVPATAVPYIADNAKVSLTFATDNFRDSDYPVYIRTIDGEKITDVKRTEMPPRNGNPGDKSFSMSLYRNAR